MTQTFDYPVLNSFYIFRAFSFVFVSGTTLAAFFRVKNPLDKRIFYKIIIAISLLYLVHVDYQNDRFREGKNMNFLKWIYYGPRDYEYNRDEKDPKYLYLSDMWSKIFEFFLVVAGIYLVRTDLIDAIIHFLPYLRWTRRYEYLQFKPW